MSRSQIRSGGAVIGVHYPVARKGAGTGLAPSCSWPVFDAADYRDQVPEAWRKQMEDGQAIFFFGAPNFTQTAAEQGLTLGSVETDQDGVPKKRELWFDFNTMGSFPHDVAVICGVQGINAVSGLPYGEGQYRDNYVANGVPTLEQYTDTCPRHSISFIDANRTCTECGHRWDHQNFISNAEGGSFWRDGWRGAEGEVMQFMIEPTESGKGVAQQLMGDERSKGVDFAIFFSKEPKPRRTRGPVFRGGGGYASDDDFLCGGSLEGFFGGGDDGDRSITPDSFGIPESTTRGLDPLAPLGAAGGFRSVAPKSMEVAAGRNVVQPVTRDPHPLDHWREKPEVVITLMAMPLAWVQRITRNGPTTKEARSGPFAGVQTV